MVPELVSLARRLAKVLLQPFTAPVHAARDLVTAHPKISLLLLLVLVVTMLAAMAGSRLAALALIPLSVAWLLLNTPFEGPTLLVLSWSHGITAADLVSVAALLIASWRLAPAVAAVVR